MNRLNRLAVTLLLAMGPAVGALSCLADEPVAVKPLQQAHAHNDYAHRRPLLDALDHGFCSVEADIFLVHDRLLVGHELKDLRPSRTLESLYLEPLRQRVQTHDGSIYGREDSFTLMIDVKTDADQTYPVLDKLLAQYADILSVTRDGKFQRKAVTVVLSGNRAREMIAKQQVRYVGMDGRPEDLNSREPADLIPWISQRWGALFSWNGDGPMPVEERLKLLEFVTLAHKGGRQVRFWATPEKEAFWKVLLEAKVDLINTDELDRLSTFLQQSE